MRRALVVLVPVSIVSLAALTACGIPGLDLGGGGGKEGEGEGETELTGDVWVDANGDAIGLFRTVHNTDDEAVDGLVDRDGVQWFVSEDHSEVRALDGDARQFFASTDCTGPRLLQSAFIGGDLRSETSIVSFNADFSELVFTIPAGTAKVDGDFNSWLDETYGCLNFDVGIYDNKPTQFYAEGDVAVVSAPAFTPPLAVERR